MTDTFAVLFVFRLSKWPPVNPTANTEEIGCLLCNELQSVEKPWSWYERKERFTMGRQLYKTQLQLRASGCKSCMQIAQKGGTEAKSSHEVAGSDSGFFGVCKAVKVKWKVFLSCYVVLCIFVKEKKIFLLETPTCRCPCKTPGIIFRVSQIRICWEILVTVAIVLLV